jgi:hypothetical protein
MSVDVSSVGSAVTPTLGTAGPWAWPRPCREEDEEGMWEHRVRGGRSLVASMAIAVAGDSGCEVVGENVPRGSCIVYGTIGFGL